MGFDLGIRKLEIEGFRGSHLGALALPTVEIQRAAENRKGLLCRQLAPR